MTRMAQGLGRVTALAMLLAVASCVELGTPSRVESAELFEPGQTDYDTYFHDVHDLQVTSTGWPDERRASLRPLVDALGLTPDAADVTLIQTAHARVREASSTAGPVHLEKSVDGTTMLLAQDMAVVQSHYRELFRAIENAIDREAARGAQLRAVPDRVDSLMKTGRALKLHVAEDFANQGGTVPKDVERELDVSLRVLKKIGDRARVDGRASEDFAAVLRRAVYIVSPPPASASAAGAGSKPPAAKPPAVKPPAAKPPAVKPPVAKPPPAAKPPAVKSPPAKAAKPPAPPQPEKPKHKMPTKPTKPVSGDVFNP